MVNFLLDVNLQHMPDEYLAGEWRVADRVLNRTDPNSVIAQATHFRLQSDLLQLKTPEQATNGRWAVQRDDLLKRPYLQMDLPQESTRALITRMRRSTDGQESQLSLYFQSGMEVQLTRP